MSHRLFTRPRAVSLFVLFAAAGIISDAPAAEPGFVPVVIARGEYRDYLHSLPIEQRPYRPLHFYGNTIRRLHYRGTVLPDPVRMIRQMRAPSAESWPQSVSTEY